MPGGEAGRAWPRGRWWMVPPVACRSPAARSANPATPMVSGICAPCAVARVRRCGVVPGKAVPPYSRCACAIEAQPGFAEVKIVSWYGRSPVSRRSAAPATVPEPQGPVGAGSRPSRRAGHRPPRGLGPHRRARRPRSARPATRTSSRGPRRTRWHAARRPWLAVTTEAVVGRGARPAAKVIPIPSPRPVTSSGALPVRDALAASPRTAAESRAPVRRDDAAGCGRNRLQSLDLRRNGATRSKARDEGRTFCPSKGLAGYYDIAGARRAAWSYEDAYTEVQRISGLVSFEPDVVEVHLGGVRQSLEPGQNVVSHGVDRNLTLDETTAAGLP
ncbi:DUF427 domain-containing protein [Streptomyces sp. NPDC051098]|uniref:DUF427 domain-containing protein n=1 Tax=Streptomyces sp. NPDC051098 TaxID=3155411 RepID=UPI0034490051